MSDRIMTGGPIEKLDSYNWGTFKPNFRSVLRAKNMSYTIKEDSVASVPADDAKNQEVALGLLHLVVIAVLLEAERRFTATKVKVNHDPSVSAHYSSALRNDHRGSGVRGTCNYCNQPGHWEVDCPKKHQLHHMDARSSGGGSGGRGGGGSGGGGYNYDSGSGGGGYNYNSGSGGGGYNYDSGGCYGAPRSGGSGGYGAPRSGGSGGYGAPRSGGSGGYGAPRSGGGGGNHRSGGAGGGNHGSGCGYGALDSSSSNCHIGHRTQSATARPRHSAGGGARVAMLSAASRPASSVRWADQYEHHREERRDGRKVVAMVAAASTPSSDARAHRRPPPFSVIDESDSDDDGSPPPLVDDSDSSDAEGPAPRGQLTVRLPESPRIVRALASSYTTKRLGYTVDSGASRHMTGKEGLFSRLNKSAPPQTVLFANGESLSSAGEGIIQLKSKMPGSVVELQRVLYVPGIAHNLISVSATTKLGAHVAFSAQSCQLISNGDVHLEGFKSNGTYIVEAETIMAPTVETAQIAKSSSSPSLWHARFGHLGYNNLSKVSQMVTGMPVFDPDETKAAAASLCTPCITGKFSRGPLVASKSPPNLLLHVLHSDLMGPLSPASRGGARYVMTVIEDYSRYSLVFLLKNKSDASHSMRQAIAFFECQAGASVRNVRSDRGGEFINHALYDHYKAKGIVPQHTMPHTPEQNGVAERINRTLTDKVRHMLAHSGMSLGYWGEAMLAANYLRNLSPSSHSNKTPYELLFNLVPDVSHLRVWGCPAFMLQPKATRTSKLSPVTLPCILVGYTDSSKDGYRVRTPNGAIRISRDVTFDELFSTKALPVCIPDSVDMSGLFPDESAPASAPSPPQPAIPPAVTPDAGSDDDDGGAGGGEGGDSDGSGNGDDTSPVGAIAPRRGERSRGPPIRYTPEAHSAVMTEPPGLSEPTTFKEATSAANPYSSQWKQASDEEISSLMENGTWELCQLPNGFSVLPVRWVYKFKRDATGQVVRFKARVVAKGFKQVEGVDYLQTFAPCADKNSFRVVLAIACERDLEMEQLDIKTAVLNGKLEETIYMQQPPGYEVGGRDMVCRLKRTLYGLKQAPRAWYLKLSEELAKIGFFPSNADPCLFIMKSNDFTAVIVHVDDMLVVGRPKIVAHTKHMLSQAFTTTDMGPAAFYTGIDIERDREHRTLKLKQRRYTIDVIERFGLVDAKTKAQPISPTTKLSNCLLYLAVCTRPDISQTVGVLARYMSCPTTAHLEAAKQVLRYVSGTRNFGICYGNSGKLVGFCDSDYAGDPDTRRSTSGIVFILNGGAVIWCSRVQPTVAASTLEAEYMSASLSAKDALWCRKILPELGLSCNMVNINCDNQGALKLISNPIASQRSKHIDVIHHFVRDRVSRREICFHYVASEHNAADILTKPLTLVKFVYCRSE
ncbi:hypothetical protein FOA52_010588 [Chlamydomonas sp. UWO 241]|nr:hypothetical protein FOA52_010588 [Chlamydomonas sp. UWO 241]